MATAKTRARRVPLATAPARRWQGFLGRLGKRPVLAVLLAVTCIGLTVGTLALVVYPQTLASYHWWRAQRAAAEFEFADARRHLAYCLEVWPTSGETYYALARAYRREGLLPQARRHLQDAKRANWSTDAIDLEFKLMQAQEGDVRAIEPLLRSYLEAGHPDQLIILEAMVIGYLKHNFLDDAYHWASYWVQLAPEMWQPRMLRAQALEQGQKPQLALQEYQNALELNPRQLEARVRIAQILLRGKQYPEAETHFAIYLRERPDDPIALAGMARCQRALQRHEQAEASVARLLTLNPDNSEACLLRGTMAWDQLRPQESLHWLRRSLALDPNALETLQLLGVVLRDLGQDQEAAEIENRRQRLEDEQRQLEGLVKELLAIEAATDRKHGDGRDEKTKVRCVEIRTTIGKTLMDRGQEREGLAWLLSAIQEDPGNLTIRRLLGDYQRKVKDREGVENARRGDGAAR